MASRPGADSEVVDLDVATGMLYLGSDGEGHVGLSVRALPVVLPVRYRVVLGCVELVPQAEDHDQVALRDAVVCLSVVNDGLAVLVTGTARALGGRTVLEPAMIQASRLIEGDAPADLRATPTVAG